MEDITPKLLEAIQTDFQSQFNKSKTIQSLYAKIRDGTATYDEANEFAIETGRLLSASFQGNLSEDVLPDGRMYYNIANRILNTTLTNNHRLITEVTSKVQTSLNKAAGIGLKAIVPDVNESRIKGLVNKVSSATEFSTVAWLFGEPVVNFSQSIVDDAIRANAEFQHKSGLSPKIVRREVGNCCDWCKEVVGTYVYPDVPEGVYKRHRYCRCTVAYEAGKRATDVHTKREYDSGDVKARIENSRAFQERMGVESQRQKAERKRQAKLQAANEETLKKQQKANRIEYAKTLSNKDETLTNRRKQRMAARKAANVATPETVEQLQRYSAGLLKKHGVNVDIADVGKLVAEGKANIDHLDNLLSEYNSTLKSFAIRKGAVSAEGGATIWASNTSTGMRILPSQIRNVKAIKDELGVGNNKTIATLTHEFAHTLSASYRNINPEFWKEMKSIKRAYKKELGQIELGKSKYTKADIFISDYADTNVDEFLAEAFAQAKLSDNPSPYAIKVLEIVDKYFKKTTKPLANAGEVVK